MESTKEVLVRRSNNLFLPFSNETQFAIGKDIAFSSDPTLFATIMSDGNIHIHGTKSAGDSGYVLLWSLTQRLVLKAGSTYNFSISATSPTQCILQSDQSGTRTNIMQVGPTFTNGLTKTMTEDTVITHVFMNISSAIPINTGDTIDEYINPMLVEQNTKMGYEPYYREYESTKEVVVRRSNNLLLPFSSYIDTVVGKNTNFSFDNTLFVTVETNGNIHIHGTKSVAHSGWYLISDFTSPLVLKAGKTYSFKCNQPYGNCILQSTVSGSRQNVIGNYGSVTPTIDTPITHLYIDMNLIDNDTNIGKEYDFYINPMLVEGDTKQDYEPYYYEAEASKTGIIPDDGSLTSVVDFSTAIKGKRISITSTTSPEGSDVVTINNNDAFAYVPEYYPCQAGDIYKIEYVGQENLPKQTYRQYFIFWYDENKNYLGFYIKYTYGAYTFDPAPTNAKFFRLTYSGLLNGAVTPKEWMLPSNPKLTKVTS